MRLGPETAAVQAGQDGPASRPLPGRAPWSSRPEGSSSSAVAAAVAASAERPGRRAAEAAEGYRWVRTTREAREQAAQQGPGDGRGTRGDVRRGGPAGAGARGGPRAYAFDPEAKNVQGAVTNVEASTLDEGLPYRSTIKPGEKLYYRVTLTTPPPPTSRRSRCPTTAARPPTATASASASGRPTTPSATRGGRTLGSGAYARPITAYASRTVKEGGSTCQEGGPYDVLVERESKADSSPEPWDLELRFLQEPKLRSGTSMPTEAPESLPSASAKPLTGKQQKRSGGSGSLEATSLENGRWQDTVAPGQTRFFRVPVDWGQQIHATAGLSNSTSGGSDFVGSALTLSLANPAQGRSPTPPSRTPEVPRPRPCGHCRRWTTATGSTLVPGQRGALRGLVLPVGLPQPEAEGVLRRRADPCSSCRSR